LPGQGTDPNVGTIDHVKLTATSNSSGGLTAPTGPRPAADRAAWRRILHEMELLP